MPIPISIDYDSGKPFLPDDFLFLFVDPSFLFSFPDDALKLLEPFKLFDPFELVDIFELCDPFVFLNPS